MLRTAEFCVRLVGGGRQWLWVGHRSEKSAGREATSIGLCVVLGLRLKLLDALTSN